MITQKEVLIQIEAILQEVLKRPDITITETTTADQVKGWDSLTNMTIIARVEEKFQCKFKFREIIKFRHIGDLCDAILTRNN